YDRGRAVVATAEGDSRDVELGAAVGEEVFARPLARGFAGSAVVFDLRDRLVEAERVGEALGISDVALRQRPALGLVASQQLRGRLALEHRSELPAQIDRVLDCGVVTEAAGRGEEVGRVAADEDAPLPE